MQSNVYYAGFRQLWANWVTTRNGIFSAACAPQVVRMRQQADIASPCPVMF